MLNIVHISAPTNLVRTSYDYAVLTAAQSKFFGHVCRAKLSAMRTRVGAECVVEDAGLIAYLLRPHGFRVEIYQEKVSV